MCTCAATAARILNCCRWSREPEGFTVNRKTSVDMPHKPMPATHARPNCLRCTIMHIHVDLLVKIFDLIFLIMARIRIHALSVEFIEKFAKVWQVGSWVDCCFVASLLLCFVSCMPQWSALMPSGIPNTIYNICMQIMYNYGLFTQIQLPLIH